MSGLVDFKELYPYLCAPRQNHLYALVILAALAAFSWFFVSQLGTGQKTGEPAGILLAPPPEYAVVNLGTTSPEAAAAQLEVQFLLPGADKVGVQFERVGGVLAGGSTG